MCLFIYLFGNWSNSIIVYKFSDINRHLNVVLYLYVFLESRFVKLQRLVFIPQYSMTKCRVKERAQVFRAVFSFLWVHSFGPC